MANEIKVLQTTKEAATCCSLQLASANNKTDIAVGVAACKTRALDIKADKQKTLASTNIKAGRNISFISKLGPTNESKGLFVD